MITQKKKVRELYHLGKEYSKSPFHLEGGEKSRLEKTKKPLRYDLINYIIDSLKREVNYLEIGVRRPEDNFNKVNAQHKFSVDPGVANDSNPVQFKMTSDDFFHKLRKGEILNKDFKFDVIFIDGLHLAEQVERDIYNALDCLEHGGFIILHDCNPPTEFHARESYAYHLSPAKALWNGTTWKAFFKFRQEIECFSCCVDSDWGLGVISKTINFGKPTKIDNTYYEFQIFEKYRKESLNLVSFEEFKRFIVPE